MATSPKTEIGTDLLRTLHRIHRQRSDLNSQLERGPRQIAASEALASQAELERDRARETLKKAKLAADEKQLQLQSREAHVEGLKAKLNTAASNKEFSLLKDQIAADEQANSVQSDEIFEALEQLDTLQSELQAAEENLSKQQQEHADRVQEIESRMTRLRSELERVESELAEAEREIPSVVRSDYTRLIAAKGEEALAPTEGNSCGGCYQTLTTQLMNQLQLSHLIHCPNCNAFLYLPEDRRVR